jgi:hypothetical protein
MRHLLLLLPFTPRYILLTIAVTGSLVLAALVWRCPQAALHLALPLALFGFLALLGLRDLVQTKHAILRNYPIAAHIRFILEHIRPELRQYFFENEKAACPSRATNAPSSISAPSRRSTSVRSAPITTSTAIKSMIETGITPDFIVVDGTEGGTGAGYASAPSSWRTSLRGWQASTRKRSKRSASWWPPPASTILGNFARTTSCAGRRRDRHLCRTLSLPRSGRVARRHRRPPLS